ncbi:hypothetical protein A4A49_32698 [Nicotiana attenuata]|uniref:Thionin-like protein 2 n=1 Tax=Nicotiana attenuata TaxID=49451 RepID=A0A1J6KJ56_NICAT|nr:hypothetical protein A4A49_32698 [Nicotiana attenuata]
MAFLATTSPIHVLALLMLIFASTKIHAQGETAIGPCVVACGKQVVACVVKCTSTSDKCSQNCAVESINCMTSCIKERPPMAMIWDMDDSRDEASMEHTINFGLNPMY